MQKNYIQIISKHFPGTAAHCLGDASIYSNVTIEGTISQAELDVKYLDDLKEWKIEQIDNRTQQLISAGFSFDGQMFSLSPNAQINWVGMKTLQALFTWPMSITTMSDTSYTLTEANLDAFVGTGSYTVQYHLTTGRELKAEVLSAQTVEAVNAIEDNR